MSWAKDSVDAGVAGLKEWEVVRGVMQGEVDIDLPEVPEEEFVKVVSRYCIDLNQCWRR